MNSIFDAHAGQVVPIRIHTWWPGDDDPFYVFNAWEDSMRVLYYAGVAPWYSSLYTPSFRFDGKYIKDPSDFGTYTEWYTFVENTIDSLAAIPSPLRIEITRNIFTPDSDSVYVDFDVIAEDDANFNMSLYLAVTEWRHRYPIPVGAHDDALRDYVPDENGYALAPMLAGDSLHFEWSYILDPEYIHAASGTFERVMTNIFIQRTGTKKVQQAAIEHPQADPTAGIDIAATDPVLLGSNSPNPFSSETNIAYSLKQAGNVRLSVYTLSGRLVTDLVDGHVEPGAHRAVWDGRDRFGRDVSSGVYYYNLDAGGVSRAGKMILLR
jgi:hypothetical protein